jgi:hypothetical protein
VPDFAAESEQPCGGVYFEAGFAFGLNIPVIWASREDLVEQVYFDTRQFNRVVWSNLEEVYEKPKIGAVLGDGPLRGRK